MIPKIDLMLDLETLGTKPGCSILSIAAVPFAVDYPLEPFYEKISAASCTEMKLASDHKTMDWWGKQSEVARKEAFSGTQHIMNVLTLFASYCRQLPAAPIIWGNGADFDAPILETAYNACGIPIPWHYADKRCYRTLKNMFSMIEQTKPRIAHNALEDARAQADTAERIFNWLASKGAYDAA